MNDIGRKICVAQKQQPVLDKLHHLMIEATAVANAIKDNAFDDQTSIPIELVTSFHRDYCHIVQALRDAANVPLLTNES